jgi:hypothetical protein
MHDEVGNLRSLILLKNKEKKGVQNAGFREHGDKLRFSAKYA